ncbi:hypothetical protein EPI10_020163 [Gossypium australe]|uniref:Transmembrane protein n=1 Tax=Gossypium australe TaxID=47621 RepID=A0A5B6WDI4_9ROSI|nr:hypothetical protein EPI10_020163 [Gossypium australe]
MKLKHLSIHEESNDEDDNKDEDDEEVIILSKNFKRFIKMDKGFKKRKWFAIFVISWSTTSLIVLLKKKHKGKKKAMITTWSDSDTSN